MSCGCTHSDFEEAPKRKFIESKRKWHEKNMEVLSVKQRNLYVQALCAELTAYFKQERGT